MGDTVRKFWKTVEWFRQPRLTMTAVKVAGWVLGVAVMICWYLTGTFTGGVLSVLTFCVLIVGWRTWAWWSKQSSHERLSGIRSSVWQQLRALFTHSHEFVDTDDRWDRFARNKGLAINGTVPKLNRKHQLPDGSVKALVQPDLLGGDLETLATTVIKYGRGPMKCKDITVTETGTGSGWITFHKNRLFDQVVSVLDLPISGTDSISIGRQEDCSPLAFLRGFNTLCVGASGTGKSRIGWNMFFDLVRDGVPTDLAVFNPKRSELALFKNWVGKSIGCVNIVFYGETVDEYKKFMVTAVEKMHQRQEKLADLGLFDLEHPTEEFPEFLIWLDEALDLADGWLKDGMTSPTGIFLSQGRNTRSWMFICSQIAQLNEFGTIRKGLNGMRIGLRHGAAEDVKPSMGIDASKLPLHEIPRGEQGVGMAILEDGAKVKFRANLPSNDHIRHLMTTGTLPEGMITRDFTEEVRKHGGVHYGYRGMNNHVGHIYTGETNKKQRRYGEHYRDDVWPGVCPLCGLVDTCRWWANHVDYTVSCKFPSRDEAKAWESREIGILKPPFNRKGKGKPSALDGVRRRTYRGPHMTRDDAPAPQGVVVWNLDPKRGAWVAKAADAPRWAPWRKTVKPLPELVGASERAGE